LIRERESSFYLTPRLPKPRAAGRPDPLSFEGEGEKKERGAEPLLDAA